MEIPMESTQSISFWQNSITRRYFLLSLLIAIVPLAMTTWFYDRFAGKLIQNLELQQIESNMDQILRSMDGFIRSREIRLKAVVDLPGVEHFVDKEGSIALPTRILSQVNYEIDSPDIYGVLFFTPDWKLRHALPGQSASGFPYWGTGQFEIEGLPYSAKSELLLIGPNPPSVGKSGWFLLAMPLNPPKPGGKSPGYAAFQIRLATLTRSLQVMENSANMQGYLQTANNLNFDMLGTVQQKSGFPLISRQLAPGWTLKFIQTGESPTFRNQLERPLFLIGVAITLLLVLTFFAILIKRIQRRITPLIDGANAISRGDWEQRIAPSGNDEFTQLALSFNKMAEHLNDLLDHRIELEKKATWGEFATGIAHEIRNPLATMKVCVQSVVPTVNESQSQEMLSLVLEEIDRVNHLIQNLLNYASPVEPQWATVHSDDILNRIYTLAIPLTREHQIDINLSVIQSCVLRADEDQLQQVLMNLVLNAIDAMKAGGHLTLQSRCESGSVILEVSDTGFGMTDEQIFKATQPFYTTKTEGSGLGLAISTRLVQLNGGTLEITSLPGLGTTVQLTFATGVSRHD